MTLTTLTEKEAPQRPCSRSGVGLTPQILEMQNVMGKGGWGWAEGGMGEESLFLLFSPGDHFCFQDPVSRIELLFFLAPLNLYNDQMDKGFH